MIDKWYNGMDFTPKNKVIGDFNSLIIGSALLKQARVHSSN